MVSCCCGVGVVVNGVIGEVGNADVCPGDSVGRIAGTSHCVGVAADGGEDVGVDRMPSVAHHGGQW